MKEASYYSTLPDNRVECALCPHRCKIPEGKRGFCLTRENAGGRLIAANYCRPVSTAIDPIEKKPLYHYYPGSEIFSTGPNGCTLKCSFCQNSVISQEKITTREIPVEKLAETVVKSGSIGAAYTYSEPFIWYETIMDMGPRIRMLGLKNVMVTNGFMERAPLNDRPADRRRRHEHRHQVHEPVVLPTYLQRKARAGACGLRISKKSRVSS